MDDAFQELDFSEISAKNINKKRSNDINIKTRGGIIRLGSMIIIVIIILILIIAIISKSNSLSNFQTELNTLKEKINFEEKEISHISERNIFLSNEVFDTKKNYEKLLKQKNNIENNLVVIEYSSKKSKEDIKNANDAISLLGEKLKEFEDIKNRINDLQNSIEFYQKEIEKLSKKQDI